MKVRSPAGLVLAALILVTLFNCTGGEPTNLNSPGPGSPSNSSSISAFVRTCASNQPGNLGKAWQKRSVLVGPIAFVGLPSAAGFPKSAFEPIAGGRYRPFFTVVVAGMALDATVAVLSPPGRASLLFDEAAFNHVNAYKVAEGEQAVTFEGCTKQRSPGLDWQTAPQYPGGIIVAGPGCVTLNVISSVDPRGTRVTVPFGVKKCS